MSPLGRLEEGMIEAVVQAGTREIPYRRAGCGAAVVLLSGTDDPENIAWLFEQLSSRFRTIAPVVPLALDDAEGAEYESVEGWLRGLIDGLGLERPSLVGGIWQGATLLRFATLDPDRVARLALVRHAGAPEVEPLTEAPAAAVQPVLLLDIPGADEPGPRAEALARLVGFLGC